MNRIAAVMGVFLIVPLVDAGVYKCVDDRGTVTYSQTQCLPPPSAEAHGPGAAQDSSADSRQATIDKCLARVRTLVEDPDCVRLDQVGAMGAETIQHAGARRTVKSLAMWISTKDSRGEYLGADLYYCFLAPRDRSVLRVSKAQ